MTGRPTAGARVWALVAIVAVAGLVAAGCGSDSDDETSTDDSTGAADVDDTTSADGETAETPTEESAADGTETGTDAADDGAADGSGSAAAGTASVTLDGVTYTADLSGSLAVCISMGGAVAGVGPVDGYDDGSLDIDLPPEGADPAEWDSPSIRLDLGNDESGTPVDYRAGGDVVEEGFPELEGMSQVDSYSIDGASATGSATFVEFYGASTGLAEAEPIEGTFEIAC